jgi:hypothetical protein
MRSWCKSKKHLVDLATALGEAPLTIP